MNFNSNNNINNQFGCLPLHSIRLRSRINRLNSKKQTSTHNSLHKATTDAKKSESLNWIRQLTFILFYRLCPGNCNFEHSLWLSPELTWSTATRPRPSSPGPGSHPWPGSDLRRPGVTDTGHSPSSLLPRHPTLLCLATDARGQFKILHQITAQFLGIKAKLQGH